MGRTFQEYYGRKIGSLNSPTNGEVVRITKDHVVVKGEDGKKRFVETVKNFPYNRLTGISYTPVVKVGDKLKEGDLVAHSSFTNRKGVLNSGRNLRTAIIPGRGSSVSGDEMVLWYDRQGAAHYTPIRKAGRMQLAMTIDKHFNVVAHAPNSFIEHETDSSMCLISTMDGSSFKTTECHSLVTLDNTGTLVEIKPYETIPGETFIPVAQPKLKFSSQITRKTLNSSSKRGKTLSNIPFDYDMGFLMGLHTHPV